MNFEVSKQDENSREAILISLLFTHNLSLAGYVYCYM